MKFFFICIISFFSLLSFIFSDQWKINFVVQKDEIIINWMPLKEASWYNLLIFKEKELKNLIWTISTKEPSAKFSKTILFSNEAFYLDIRAINENGKQISCYLTSSIISPDTTHEWIDNINISVSQKQNTITEKKSYFPIFSQTFSYSENKYINSFFQTYNLDNNFNWTFEKLNLLTSSNLTYENSLQNNFKYGFSFCPRFKEVPLSISYNFNRYFSSNQTYQNVNFNYYIPKPVLNLNFGYSLHNNFNVFSFQTLYTINNQSNISLFYQDYKNSNSFSIHFYRRY
ncbi:MAG: hypothetical protein ABIB46_02365 [bacterium]